MLYRSWSRDRSADFQQIIDFPMRTNCASFFIDPLLWCRVYTKTKRTSTDTIIYKACKYMYIQVYWWCSTNQYNNGLHSNNIRQRTPPHFLTFISNLTPTIYHKGDDFIIAITYFLHIDSYKPIAHMYRVHFIKSNAKLDIVFRTFKTTVSRGC